MFVKAILVFLHCMRECERERTDETAVLSFGVFSLNGLPKDAKHVPSRDTWEREERLRFWGLHRFISTALCQETEVSAQIGNLKCARTTEVEIATQT